jgi:hypothetical protein
MLTIESKLYEQDGFLVVPNLLNPTKADELVRDIRPLMTSGDLLARRMQDGWLKSSTVKDLATHPKILELLSTLYGRRPIPFQTLNFSRGSEQTTHSDAYHFNSIPRGFMCGVWVALEDITSENGPLHYYPGSHRAPERFPGDELLDAQNQQISYAAIIAQDIEKFGLKKTQVQLKKGDAFIWSSNLFHGGDPIADTQSTRWSQVTHYYFENCIYYTPALSCRPLGQFFLRRIVDISTGQPVSISLNGKPIRARQNAKGTWSIDVPSHNMMSLKSRLTFWLRSRINFVNGFTRKLLLRIRGPIVYLE